MNEYVDNIAKYVARYDYGCALCKTARNLNGARQLLVGCAGRDEFVRWHPRAQTETNMENEFSLIRVTCEFNAATGLGNEDDEACWHNGKLLRKVVVGGYPSGADLEHQAFTSTMPYCPPGWYVNTTQFDNEEQFNTDEWQPANCIRCTVCGMDSTKRMRSSEWMPCPGHFTTDTQTCVPHCDVGQYNEGTTCEPCRSCGD